MATEGTVAPFRVGQRVMNSNKEKGPQIGTVMFVGSVEGYQGTWVGVDWDNGEGRHDGTVNGVHYFDADGEKSGSFVRPQALTAGRTLYAALVERYKGGTNGDQNGYAHAVSAWKYVIVGISEPLCLKMKRRETTVD